MRRFSASTSARKRRIPLASGGLQSFAEQKSARGRDSATHRLLPELNSTNSRNRWFAHIVRRRSTFHRFQQNERPCDSCSSRSQDSAPFLGSGSGIAVKKRW